MTASADISLEMIDGASLTQRRLSRLVAGIRAIAGRQSLRQLLSLLDQAIFAATIFLTTLIVGRICSREELGVFYLAFTLVMFFRGAQAELTSSPYTVYCHRRTGPELATYAGSTLVFHLWLTALGVACLCGAAVVGRLAGGELLFTLGSVLAAVLPFMLLREYIRRFAFAHLQLIAVTVLDAAIACLQLGGLLLLAQAGRLSIAATYGVMGLACAIASGIWFLRCRRMFSFQRAAWLRDWRHNWQFSRWTLSGFMVGSATPVALPWLLAFGHGEAAAGVLAACQTLVGVSNMFVTGISNVLTTQAAHAFATGGVAAVWRVIVKTAALYSILLGGLCLVFFLVGEALIALAFQREYAGARPVLALLSLSVFAQGLSVTAGNGLWAIERPRTNLAADLCALATALAVAACLIAPLGVLGVAIASFSGLSAAPRSAGSPSALS
jgi:O-antigen/teichoic acid export membrane protein